MEMIWDGVSKLRPAGQMQPTPALGNELELEHSHAHSFRVSCGGFLPTEVGLSSQSGNHIAHQADGVYCLAVTKRLLTPDLGESLAEVTGAGKGAAGFHCGSDTC